MVCPTTVVLLFLFLFFPISITAQPYSLLFQFCEPKYGKFTPNSSYHKSLTKALSSITQNSINSHGLYARSSGDANVIGLCRGDVTHADCFSCLNASRQQLPDQCPVSKEAVGWQDSCMLRYSDRSNISVAAETEPSVVFYNLNNVTSGAARFDDVVVRLLNFLAGRAASGGPGLKFATGNVSDAEAGTVYGLVQCLPGLSGKECDGCLGDVIAAYPKYFGGRIGGRILAPSCNYRYEVSIFYNITAEDTPLTAPAPAPALAPPQMDILPPPPVQAPPPNIAVAPSTNNTNTQGEETKTSGTAGVCTSYAAALILVILSIVLFL